MVIISQLVLGRNKGNDNFNFRLLTREKMLGKKYRLGIEKSYPEKLNGVSNCKKQNENKSSLLQY